jgi:hypothetical protein
MACGCGGKSGKRAYQVTTTAGRTQEVDTLQAAMNIVRKEGGHYVIIKK